MSDNLLIDLSIDFAVNIVKITDEIQGKGVLKNQILKIANCSCGQTHFCDIEGVFIYDGATNNIDPLLKQYRNVLLVADQNTYNAAGEQVEKVIKNKISNRVVFSGDKILIPDEVAVEVVDADSLECRSCKAFVTAEAEVNCIKAVSENGKVVTAAAY